MLAGLSRFRSRALIGTATVTFAALCLGTSGAFAAAINIYGNHADGDMTEAEGDADGNSLNVDSGTYNGHYNGAIGGYAGDDPTETASGNRLGLNDDAINLTDYAIGGAARRGAASSNQVVVIGGTIGKGIIGGKSLWGNVSGNTVEFSGGTSKGDVYGGLTNLGDATGNSVTISGSASAEGDVTGGRSSDGGDVTGNSVVVDGGTIGGLDLGTVVAGAVGGAGSGSWAGSTNPPTGAVSGNTVTINGGTVAGAAIGGLLICMDDDEDLQSCSGGSATGNTVNINGGTAGGGLFGGYALLDGSADVFTGNTLNLRVAGFSTSELANFQYLNFYLPTNFQAGETMLHVSGTADLTNGSGTASTVNVGIDGASSPLARGDTVKLIEATTLNATGINTTADGHGMQGVTLAYVFDLTTTATTLSATVSSVGTTEGSKALSEGYIAGAILANKGSDLLAGAGMANAIAAGSAPSAGFVAMSGGHSSTDTGSHVDLDSVSALAGLSRELDLASGRLTIGAFAEYGHGSQDTYNAFASGPVEGHGDSSYVGGGLLGHMNFSATGPGHLYAEAALRAGLADNDFASADLASLMGVSASYDTSAAYYGANAAVGYLWSLGAATSVDLFTKLYWTRLGGDTVRLSTGDTVDFDAVDSARTSVGALFSYAVTKQVTGYAGAAWEHEFDGKARATSAGLSIDAPSMEGDTGVLQVGLKFTPSADLPLTVDLGLAGTFGQREGIVGSLQAKLAF